MRNIYLIRTDKPSRLVKIKETYFLTTSTDIPAGVFYNIYIISDEIPTEGDALMRTDTSRVFCTLKGANPSIVQKYCRKIILTSDHSLEGVQQIDDEFLEWFVKNTNCEQISVEEVYFHGNGYYKASELSEQEREKYSFMKEYKIIIPKEEDFELVSIGEKTIKLVTPMIQDEEEIKQKTLEDYVLDSDEHNNLTSDDGTYLNFHRQSELLLKGAKLGSEWQQEQNKNLYSEEEIKQLFESMISEIEFRKQNIILSSEKMTPHLLEGGCMAFESSQDVIKEKFEQFKKKL